MVIRMTVRETITTKNCLKRHDDRVSCEILDGLFKQEKGELRESKENMDVSQ
jgi:ribosome-associated toxin RatA of RatAB toxin-antitoxin module